jgi:hypothetical protein
MMYSGGRGQIAHPQQLAGTDQCWRRWSEGVKHAEALETANP